jgi:transcription-repair coupling factor (superfamily II helicase)
MTTSHPTYASVFDGLLELPEFAGLAAQVRAGRRVVVASGLVGGAKALAVAALQRATGRPVLYVTPQASVLESARRDVEYFYCALHGVDSCSDTVLALPESESDPYDGTSPHGEILEERALTLFRLARGSAPIVLTTLRGALKRTVAPERLLDLAIEFVVGEDRRIEDVVDTLLAAGYVREDPVGAAGEFSARGGIVDVFPPGRETPVRIEFFGDTVDSIRAFDPETQRSVARMRDIVVPPMREQPSRRRTLMTWAEAAGQRWDEPRFGHELRARLAAAERGEEFPGWEYLVPLVEPLAHSLFDYLGDAVVVVDEPSEVEQVATQFADRLAARHAEAHEAGELVLPPSALYMSGDELREACERLQRLDLRVLGKSAARVDAEFELDGGAPLFLFPLPAEAEDFHVASQAAPRYHGRVRELAGDLARAAAAGAPRLLVMPSLGVAERVVDMLREYEVEARLAPTFEGDEPATASRAPVVAVGQLASGFRLPGPDLTVLVETDLFAAAELQTQRRQPKRRRSAASAFLSDFRDLKAGDFVVHVDHGIGQFQGLVQLPVAAGTQLGVGPGKSGTREFMLLTYADEAKLYVPVERLDLVQKYSAAEGHEPQKDRLGGVGWEKTKARAKRAMRDMAEELLKLYAERKLVEGHAFPADGPWQQEFEEAFEYQLTEDQETAVADVKRDMEQHVPMDRLLCGDVGYGKTEVAMRAVFKAVMDGKQVAVLAPTTVLVFQHFKTLQQRFAAFPVTIEMLSRFVPAKEQKAIVERVEAGAVDIVVGTHRLLSKDMKFKDLGLVVVDEEQRFGVAHKERLKQLRKRVDVLTMSATPIPRTLNMSLVGLRDMSVIETPPRDRLAIHTTVVPFSEGVIRSAIEQELARGGQTFFVHNRVETIFTIAELVQRIVPSARVGVGHGQMPEKELEEAMMKFIRHELDVLVSTTIIENGIDIPLANTIVINRADTFGLAQLYQLRGRVGRSNRRAYAYLLIPNEATITPIARKRLAAIREFSDLGAGFRIAALDLELRGAGNLLGGQQSGHVNAIGFDLYTQMLERTVRELRGEEIEDEQPTTAVNLNIDVRIPDDYIYDINQRLRTYKRIASAGDDAEVEVIRAEIADRYGPIPPPVDNLLGYARVRNRATALGVVSIDRDRERLAVKLGEKTPVAPERLLSLVSENPGASFSPTGVLRVNLGRAPASDGEVLAEVEKLLRHLDGQA